ncbi:glycosyltransferase family 2 protein [Colwellia sp. KU-HH00111]|uniref:glycosyltransferase family 2 protein n=1 Tax=Colwellia sp. KU-HH00111 TaxID=3127652 RepID=UPI00310AFD16
MEVHNTSATIAIITCRRPIWLKRLLESLTKQNIDDSTVLNILVVDNASEQTTVDVVNEVSSLSPFKITYACEKTPGIVAARNKCVTEFLQTDAQYLFFIDDDEWPAEESWAQNLLNKQKEYNADVVTSHILSVGEPGTPEWAVELIYGKNPLQEGETVNKFYTNNLLICRHVLEQINPAFDKRFAMTGASDYHFALKCTKAGFKAFYTNAPVIEEFPKSRATVKWFLRRGFRSGIGFTRSHLFEDSLFSAIFFCLTMASVRLVRAIGYFLLGIVTLNKTTLVNSLFRFCSFAGTIAGFFGIKHEEYKTIHGN